MTSTSTPMMIMFEKIQVRGDSYNMMRQLYESNTGDYTVVLEDKKIMVHSIILKSNSDVFLKLIETPMEEKLTAVIDLSEYKSHVIQLMFTWMYCRAIPEKLSIDDIFELLHILDFFQVNQMKNILIDEVQNKINGTNSCEIALKCYEYPVITDGIYEKTINALSEKYFKCFHEHNWYTCYDEISPGFSGRTIDYTSYVCCKHYKTNRRLNLVDPIITNPLTHKREIICISLLTQGKSLEEIRDLPCYKNLCCFHRNDPINIPPDTGIKLDKRIPCGEREKAFDEFKSLPKELMNDILVKLFRLDAKKN
ncbi:MAG: kelch-like protein 7 [Harvfovirus sp.]|uniref:Kelch-like protein 7 n=1 Tax=Harvfovirus sp. TaxID=2487768 RepID=A0A3G5A330_9VIRU|nr:MAG: kelch-like protein 7 [Harvfovirus sp.]